MEDKKERGGYGVSIAVVILAVIYVFLPVVLVVPMRLLKRAGVPVDGEVVFWPLIKLDKACPPYHALIESEDRVARKFLRGEP